MLSDSKIMTKTSVGRTMMAATMRDGSTNKTYPYIYTPSGSQCQDDSQ